MRRIILFFWIICLPGQAMFSQDHKTRNNYTGAWETPASWDPAWPEPQTDVNNSDITIYGYITANNSLSFSGSSSKLIVDDTLVIRGDLTIADNNDVQVNNDGILIVRGNLTISDLSKIEAKNYIIVTGNITKLGSTNNGEFSSDDDPVKVFIGGTISPTSLTIYNPNFIAFNCSEPTTTPYPHSGCSYGDMTDIITDPIYPFFQSTCTTATLTSSDADNSFCAGTSVTFTAGGGTDYNFRVNGTSVQNGESATYTTTTLTNGTIVDVIVTDTDGCTALSAGITNTVFALPVATATYNSPVCAGSPLTLTGGPAGMTAYSWTGPDGFTANIQSPTVSPAATAATVAMEGMAGSYSLTVTDGNGCTSAAATTTVVVNALPIASATSNSPVFTGSPLTLTGGPAGMTAYSWTGPDGFTANTRSPVVSPAATLAMEGIYSLTVADTSGCTSLAVTTTVVVNALPVATATSNSPVCAGSPLTLTGGPAGMTIYSWTGPDGFTANTQSPAVSPAATAAMAGIYSLTVTDANGSTGAAVTTTVVVNALPVATASSNSPVCAGSLLTLTGGPAGMRAYSWTGPGGFTANTRNPVVSPAATLAMEGIYSLAVTDVNGCIETTTQSVHINETPVAIAGPDQELEYIFETQMRAELSSSETGEWSLISGSGRISDIHSPTSLVTGLSPGENMFFWKVQNSYCEASAEVKITVHDVFIPSVITPDGDGKNDYFKISENIGKVQLIIFNRWGNEEYTNDGYKNDWDGRNSNGAELPVDTYFYVLKFENGRIEKGSVLIKR